MTNRIVTLGFLALLTTACTNSHVSPEKRTAFDTTLIEKEVSNSISVKSIDVNLDLIVPNSKTKNKGNGCKVPYVIFETCYDMGLDAKPNSESSLAIDTGDKNTDKLLNNICTIAYDSAKKTKKPTYDEFANKYCD